jgi:hypothetical protein
LRQSDEDHDLCDNKQGDNACEDDPERTNAEIINREGECAVDGVYEIKARYDTE